MRPSILVVGFCTLAAGWGGSRPADAASPGRAFVLDTGAKALVTLELPSGKQLDSLTLAGAPWALLQSPDGSRLVVLDRGPGEDKGERGYKAVGRSSATIVDSVGPRVLARVELGNGIEAGWSAFSPDGRRLTLLCPGYEPKNPAQALARELVNLDLREGRESGRLTLDPGVVPLAASQDGRSLALIQGWPRTAKYPYPQSRLHVVDLAGPSVRARVDMGGWADLYSDGSYVYLMDPGKPSKDPRKNRNGTVDVASVDTASLAGRLDAGRDPRGLYRDEAGGQVFIPSAGPPEATGGLLSVVRGDAVAATLKVAADPKLVVRSGDVVLVVGESAVTLVDPTSLQVEATIPLARGGHTLVDDGDLPTELQVSADGKRACVHYGLHHKVAVLDLETKQAIGSTKTGSGGKKLFGHMMGGMFGMAGYLAAGYTPWTFTEPKMLAMRPDGRYGYAINSQTKDVTVVDTATGKSMGTIGGSGYSLEPLADGRFLLEVSGSDLRLIDTETNRKAGETSLSDLRGLFFPKDRSVALALAKGAVLVLDGTTGQELARLSEFVSPDAVAFAQ